MCSNIFRTSFMLLWIEFVYFSCVDVIPSSQKLNTYIHIHILYIPSLLLLLTTSYTQSLTCSSPFTPQICPSVCYDAMLIYLMALNLNIYMLKYNMHVIKCVREKEMSSCAVVKSVFFR